MRLQHVMQSDSPSHLISNYGDIRVCFVAMGIGKQIVAEADNVLAIASMILCAQIERRWFVRRNKFPNSLWVCTAKLVDALFGVRKRNQSALLAQNAYELPFIWVGILEFINDYQRIGVAHYRSKGVAPNQ